MMLPRRFLWIVTAVILLVLAVALVWRLAGDWMMRAAFTPSSGFDVAAIPPAPDYAADTAWVSRPGMVRAGGTDPALWVPEGYAAAPRPPAALFFVSPTAFLDRTRWNAPLDDVETNDRLDTFIRMQATVFNGIAGIWAPRYRQAAIGAFYTPGEDADQALDVAYGDVVRAFDAFLAAQPADTPLILAGHSQGSRHLLHLLRERHGDLADRLVAVYAAGWPVVLPQDTDAIGLPACTIAEQTGCVLSWQTYAANGDVQKALTEMARVPDLSGKPMGAGATMACTNPLTGTEAPAGPEANSGTLFGNVLEPRRVGARCDAGGLLLIEPAPSDIGPYVMPGGNYHVYDYALFWARLRSDAEARLSAFDTAGDMVTHDDMEPTESP